MRLTKAQRRVLDDLRNGGQLWTVSYDFEDDPTTHQIVAVFADGEFVGTYRPQWRRSLRFAVAGS